MHATLRAVCETGVQVSDVPGAARPSGSLLGVTRPVSDAASRRAENVVPS